MDWSEAAAFDGSAGCVAPPAAGAASALADVCEAQVISTRTPLKVAVFISAGVVLAGPAGPVLASGWVFVCGFVGVVLCGVSWGGGFGGVVWASATPNAIDRVNINDRALIQKPPSLVLLEKLSATDFFPARTHGSRVTAGSCSHAGSWHVDFHSESCEHASAELSPRPLAFAFDKSGAPRRNAALRYGAAPGIPPEGGPQRLLNFYCLDSDDTGADRTCNFRHHDIHLAGGIGIGGPVSAILQCGSRLGVALFIQPIMHLREK